MPRAPDRIVGSKNDLPDCLKKAKKRELSERSWIVPVAEIAARNYDLTATNPNAAQAIKHRSPTAIAADIASKQTRILEIMEEVQEMLEPQNGGEQQRP